MPQLAKLIREKHPGSYDNVDDATLERAVLEKYPQYKSLATPEEDPVVEAKKTLAAAPKSFVNSVPKNDLKEVITASDEYGAQIEPTTFWGGFRKSIADQFWNATTGNESLQGAAHPQSLGDVAGLLLPSGVPQISKLIPRAKKVEEKVAAVVKTEPKVVKEPKIDIGKNKTSNTTNAAILDSKGREIAPPQELIPNRPEGPWDKNIPRDDNSILPIKKDVKVAKDELVVKPKGVAPNMRAKMHRGANDPVDIFFKDSDSREIFGSGQKAFDKDGSMKKGWAGRFQQNTNRIVQKYGVTEEEARKYITSYNEKIRELGKAAPKYGEKIGDLTVDAPSFEEFIGRSVPEKVATVPNKFVESVEQSLPKTNILDEINFSDTGKDIVGRMGKSGVADFSKGGKPKIEVYGDQPYEVKTIKVNANNPKLDEEVIKLLKKQIDNIEYSLANPELKPDGTRKYSDKIYDLDRKNLEEAKRDLARLTGDNVKKGNFADQVLPNEPTITAPPDFTAPSFGSRREPLPIAESPKNVNLNTGELIEPTTIGHPLDNMDGMVEMHGGADLTKFDKILNFGGTMKSLMSGPDLSGLRQGFPLIGTPEYWKSIKPMVQAARSEGNFAKIQEAIKTRPNAQPSIMQGKSMISKYKAGGLKLTDLGERLSGREEEIMSHAPEDLRNAFKDSSNIVAKGIRGVGNVYRGSNRAFTAYMNNLRATRFDKLIDLAAKGGHDINDPEFLKQIGTYINNATGRGSLGDFEGAAKLLNTVAFSPRLMQSRLHFINPMNYAQANPVARKEMWKSLAAMSGFLVGTGELANFTTGAKFELDPRSADFGKIRIGNTRIDMGGGFLPYIRLLSQLATQSKVNSETGKVTKFKDSKYDNASTMDTLGTFGRTKESPLLSLVHDWASGEDFKGDPFQYDEGVAKRVTPMILQDILEVSKNNPELLPITIPASVFGVGVQSYDSKRRKK